MEIKTTEQIYDKHESYDIDKKWVAVDDLIELLQKDDSNADSMMYQQGWYIVRYLEKLTAFQSSTHGGKDDTTSKMD